MSLLTRLLTRPCGNRIAQTLLEKSVRLAHSLMGIGSGGGADSSGEKAIFAFLRKSIPPPYIIFDVGSNKGQFLKLITTSLKSDGISVHCFEPGKETFRILTESAAGDPRVTMNNCALSREPGEAKLFYDNTGSGLASLTQRKLDHFNIEFNQSEEIRVSTIDEYCADKGIKRIHLLKIDIEGHELDALAGAQNMFARGAVDIVTFEFGGCNIDTRTYFQDFWYFFTERNFEIYRISPSGYFHKIRKYREFHEQFRTTNFLARRKTTSQK